MAMNSVTILDNSDGTSGLNMKQKGTNGAGHVRPLPGPVEVPRNREYSGIVKPANIAAVATGELSTITWPAVSAPTEITVSCLHGAIPTINYTSTTGESQSSDGVWVAFGAGSSGTAATWLSEIVGWRTTASQRYFIPVNASRTFRFTGVVERVDMVANFNSTNNDFDVVLEAL